MRRYSLGKEKEYFTENLAMLVKSGMPISAALESMYEDVKNKKAKQTILALKKDVERGKSMSKSLEGLEIFNSRTLSLIKIGEETGKLAENLAIIASQEDKEKKFKSKIQSALMYPVFVLFVTLIVGISITWLILPRLAIVFKQLDIELPAITAFILALGDLLGKYGIVIVPSFTIILGGILYILFVNSKTKILGDYLFFTIPGVKNLIKEVEISRFGYLLGTLLESGIPISKSLELLVSSSYFPHYKKFYVFLHAKVVNGESIGKSFKKYKDIQKIFPSAVLNLVATSEQTSNLPSTLIKIGENYEERTEGTLKNLAAMLEPFLLIFVWFGVLIVALSVILPIYNLVGNLDQATQQENTYNQ